MKKILFIITTSIFLLSCEKEKIFTDSIYEKWYIDGANPMGILFNKPSNVSYIEFKQCSDSICSGVDYRSTDKTTGSFKYQLKIEENILIIDDLTTVGGTWDDIWTIEPISNSEMLISQDHRFGNLSYKLIKK